MSFLNEEGLFNDLTFEDLFYAPCDRCNHAFRLHIHTERSETCKFSNCIGKNNNCDCTGFILESSMFSKIYGDEDYFYFNEIGNIDFEREPTEKIKMYPPAPKIRILSDDDIKSALYYYGPTGLGQLRQYLRSKFGNIDEEALKMSLGRLVERYEITVVSINNIALWSLPGQI